MISKIFHIVLLTTHILLMGRILTMKWRQVRDLRQWVGVSILCIAYWMLFYSLCCGVFKLHQIYGFLWSPLFFLLGFYCIQPHPCKRIVFAWYLSINVMIIPYVLYWLLMYYLHLPFMLNIILLLFCLMLLYYALHHWLLDDFAYAWYHKHTIWWVVLTLSFVGFVGWFYSLQDYITMMNQSVSMLLYSGCLVIGNYALLFFILHTLHEGYRKEHDNQCLVLQYEALRKHIKIKEKENETTRIYRHDMRHHITMIQSYLAYDKVEQASAYIEEIANELYQIPPMKYSEHEHVNVLLSTFYEKARQMGITMNIDCRIPREIHVKDSEITSILANALENAIQATAKVEKSRIIEVSIKIFREQLLIEIINPCKENLILQGKRPIRNHLDEGYGMKSMIAIISKYHGVYDFTQSKDHEVTLRIVL